MDNDGISRRDALLAGAGLAAFAGLGLPSNLLQTKEKKMEVKLVRVPEHADIEKAIAGTAGVGMSAKTHEEHLKLWQGYANKTNEIRKALAELDTDPAKANQIYSPMRALKVNYAFAYGGYVNHNVYFQTLGGKGGPATGEAARLINAAYGSFEHWAADWKATGIAGRGWVYLGYDSELDEVRTFIGDAQDTFPTWNNHLVLAMDVYEHAYYLDFQTARAKYIDAYMQVIDWDAVNARIAAAKR
ncbi:MAG: superoxide dismutase [Armatimonadetes bacterium]|nr:superoxide dismutase [Armatimonadota bacterium]